MVRQGVDFRDRAKKMIYNDHSQEGPTQNGCHDQFFEAVDNVLLRSEQLEEYIDGYFNFTEFFDIIKYWGPTEGYDVLVKFLNGTYKERDTNKTCDLVEDHYRSTLLNGTMNVPSYGNGFMWVYAYAHNILNLA